MGGGEVIKKGWLIKSPPLDGGGGIKKAWRRRFFKLRSSKVLEYYKNEVGDLLKGVINLEDCKSVHSDLAHKKYKYIFDVETRERTYYLVAQSQDEMKGWVDQICMVCGLQVQDVPDVASPPVSVSLPTLDTDGGDSGPSITSPLYATRPPDGTGGVAFNTRFRPSEGGGGGAGIESMYSLAQSVETGVRRELSGGVQEVPAGTPLFEALASKGIASGTPRSSSISSAHGGDAVSSHVSEASAPLPPHNEEDTTIDSYNLYSPSPQNNSLTRPVPKPRAVTLNPDHLGSPSLQQFTSSLVMADQVVGGGGGGGGASPSLRGRGGRAEVLDNGYMKPREFPVRSNYDHLPPGPPRSSSTQSPSTTPSKHRSALLRERGTSFDEGSPTYINMRRYSSDFAPTVNRSIKPPAPSPPKVDRKLKPNESPPVPNLSLPISPARSSSLANMHQSMCNSESDSSSDECFTRTSSSDSAPSFPVRISSLANTLEASCCIEESFNENSLPQSSVRTTQYTQISFDTAGKPCINEDHEVEPPPLPPPEPHSNSPGRQADARRIPIPAPRKGLGRVNYSDVNIMATRALGKENQLSAQGREQVTLDEAEMEALKDKPYINVIREGGVDEESDPDYYTHMRNLTYEEALALYNMEENNIDGDDDDDDGDDDLAREVTGVTTS